MAWNVILTDKNVNDEIILSTCGSEESARRLCEMWGWNYDDGQKSYWMDYEEV